MSCTRGQWCSGVSWPELMVRWTAMTGADGGGDVHPCVGPMSSSCVGCGAPSSDPVRCNCISLFKEELL
jgi:hypothetical protein